jgi:wobble nucleotide-excising tRNase
MGGKGWTKTVMREIFSSNNQGSRKQLQSGLGNRVKTEVTEVCTYYNGWGVKIELLLEERSERHQDLNKVSEEKRLKFFSFH